MPVAVKLVLIKARVAEISVIASVVALRQNKI
jgi:hypothetical protein